MALVRYEEEDRVLTYVLYIDDEVVQTKLPAIAVVQL